jgi:hypothetical protein
LPSATPTVTPSATPSPASTGTPTPSPTPDFATCPATPSATCSDSLKGQLQLGDNADDDAKDKLIWKFLGGPALEQADFGDPTSDASYALCIYDDGVLKVEVRIPADNTKWSEVGAKGYKYKDGSGTPDGATKAKFLGGDQDRSKLQVKGKGTELPMPTPVSATQFFNNTTGVTAQLREENGDCYETSFTPGQATKNTASKFKAKF